MARAKWNVGSLWGKALNNAVRIDRLACRLWSRATFSLENMFRRLMSVVDLSDEEFARRGAGSRATECCWGGNAIFEERVRPNVDVDAEGHKFVAIDVETGAYAVHEDERTATKQLLERQPEAEGRIWFRRVGSESAHHLGASRDKRRRLHACNMPLLVGKNLENAGVTVYVSTKIHVTER